MRRKKPKIEVVNGEIVKKKVMLPINWKNYIEVKDSDSEVLKKNKESMSLIGLNLGEADVYEWEKPEDLQSVYKYYFKNVLWKHWTITDLKIIAGGKKNFEKYSKMPGFKEVIDWAMLMVERSYEQSIRYLGRTTDIFMLKQFGGWKDKKDLDINVKRMIVLDEKDSGLVQ